MKNYKICMKLNLSNAIGKLYNANEKTENSNENYLMQNGKLQKTNKNYTIPMSIYTNRKDGIQQCLTCCTFG